MQIHAQEAEKARLRNAAYSLRHELSYAEYEDMCMSLRRAYRDAHVDRGTSITNKGVHFMPSRRIGVSVFLYVCLPASVSVCRVYVCICCCDCCQQSSSLLLCRYVHVHVHTQKQEDSS